MLKERPGLPELPGRKDPIMDHLDEPREACGIVAVYGVSPVAPTLHSALFSLQHRGQEGAGIVVSDGRVIRSHKGMGLVNDVFTAAGLAELTGHLGIGHVRYSTTGSDRIQNEIGRAHV